MAKLLGTVPVGLFLGVVGTLGLVATAAPVLAWQGDGAYLDSGRVWQTLLLGVVVTALWAVLGAAFGAVLTNQVAAIVVVLAFTQFVEPVARVALAAFEPVSGVAAYLPGAAADAVVGASLFSGFGGGDLLPRWGGALVLLAYVAALGARRLVAGSAPATSERCASPQGAAAGVRPAAPGRPQPMTTRTDRPPWPLLALAVR